MLNDLQRSAFARWATECDIASYDIIAVAGLDAELVSRLHEQNETAPLRVFEPSQTTIDREQPLLNGADVVVFSDSVSFRREIFARMEKGGKLLSVEHDQTPSVLRAFATIIAEVQKKIDTNNRTYQVFAQSWADSVLGIIPRLATSTTVRRLHGCLGGLPGIVVGAGPSLDKNMEELRRLKGHAAICAVNSSILALQNAGIEPDAVCTMDCQSLTVEQLSKVEHPENITLIAGIHANPAVFDIPWKRTIVAVVECGPPGDWLLGALQEPGIATAGSVATAALASLECMGCNPLILVGMDCAIGEKRMHVEHSGVDDELSHLENGLVRLGSEAGAHKAFPVPAWGGEGEVLTIPGYDLFRQWLEEAALALEAEGKTFINATEGGARIAGWTEHRLADVKTVRDTPVDIDSWIEHGVKAAKPVDFGALSAGLASELRNRTALLRLLKNARKTARKLDRLDREFRALLKASPFLASGSTTRLSSINADTPSQHILQSYDIVAAEVSRGIGARLETAAQEIRCLRD